MLFCLAAWCKVLSLRLSILIEGHAEGDPRTNGEPRNLTFAEESVPAVMRHKLWAIDESMMPLRVELFDRALVPLRRFRCHALVDR